MPATITTLTTRETTPDGLIWEEPPTKAKPGKYAGTAAALKARPGAWAVIRTYDATHKKRAWGFSSAINSGKFSDLADGFESVARSTDSQVRVYVRYQPVAPVSA